MRAALAAAALLGLLAVANAAGPWQVCGTKGSKDFAIKRNKFVDVGAQGGYAQRAFNELAKQVTAALIQDGFLPKKAKLTGYLEERGCYKTLIRKGTKNMIGEYEFLYGAEYSHKPIWGGKVEKDYYEIKAVGVFTRNKILLKGKADVVEIEPLWE